MIDYYLANVPAGPATLEVLDAKGRVVRRFSSAAPAAGDSARTAGAALAAAGTPSLPAKVGTNRFVWDMTYPGPWSSDTARNGRNGPMAAPGVYSVRLSAGDVTQTQPLVLRADPRVVKDGLTTLDLQRQAAHNLRVRDLVSAVNAAAERVRTARERLEKAAGAATSDSAAVEPGTPADTLRRLAAIERELVTPSVRYSKPALQTHIQYLYSMELGADQKVGRDAVQRYEELRKQLATQVAAIDALLGSAERSVGARGAP
jgi:hypothetical protein